LGVYCEYMKYEGTRKSSGDKDIDVHLISLGLKEIELLRGMVIMARQYTPKILETTPMRGRLKNFQMVLDKILNENHEKKS